MTQNQTTWLNQVYRYQLASTFVIALLQFILLLLIGRNLGGDALGWFTVVQLAYRMAHSIFDPGMWIATIQKRVWNLALAKKLLSYQGLWLIICLCFFIFYFIQSFHPTPYFTLTLILCISIFVLIAIGSQYSSALIREDRQREWLIIQLIAYSLEFIFILLGLKKLEPLILFCTGIFIRFGVLYLLSLLIYIRVLQKEQQLGESKELVTMSNYHVATQGLSYLQGNYDTVLVGSLFGLSILGLYNLACELCYILFSKLNPVFNKTVFSVLSRKDFENNTNQIRLKTILSYLYLLVPAHIVLFFNLETIFKWIYERSEKDLLLVAGYFSFIALIKGVSNILTNFVLTEGRSKLIFYWNLVVAILNYLIILFFLFNKISLPHFLQFQLIYSFFLLFITIFYILKEGYLTVEKSERQWLLFLLTVLLWLGIIVGLKDYFFGFAYFCLCIVSYLLIFYLCNKAKLIQLLQLKIS